MTNQFSRTNSSRTNLIHQAVSFAHWLRARQVATTTQGCISYLDALAALAGPLTAKQLYWAGRITLVNNSADLEKYDAAFAEFWADRQLDTPADLAEVMAEPDAITLALDSGERDDLPDEQEQEQERPDTQQLTIRYSATETLRHADFASLDDQEQAEIRRLIAEMTVTGPTMRSHRMRPSNRPQGAPDIRRTVSAALRTDGEILRWHRQSRRWRQRNLVLLVDVSGSMSPYAQALLCFAHVLACARRKVEVFAMGTRLTRLTRELSGRNAEQALGSAVASVADWSGGTRLGETLATFNRRWGMAGMARGAVVVILSDGWDRGEPEQISEQMLRLSRVAYKIIWVNPLAASPGYAPLAQGMAAALPFVDSFVEGHSLGALEELAEIISVDAEATAATKATAATRTPSATNTRR